MKLPVSELNCEVDFAEQKDLDALQLDVSYLRHEIDLLLSSVIVIQDELANLKEEAKRIRLGLNPLQAFLDDPHP